MTVNKERFVTAMKNSVGEKGDQKEEGDSSGLMRTQIGSAMQEFGWETEKWAFRYQQRPMPTPWEKISKESWG